MPNGLRVRLQPVSSASVSIEDAFWKPRIGINRTVTLPVLYKQNRTTGALKAYQWEWDPSQPNPPWRIWLGDVTKWIEAAAHALMTHADKKLERMARNAIKNVLKGQKTDGYLYANPIAPDKRWADLQHQHELYDVGHAIEAAVAWQQATGDGRFLEAMCRCVDLVDSVFGPQKGKRHGYPGHEEIELALVKLYRATAERRYLNLAKYFIDQRGHQPYYFDREAIARGEDPGRRRLGGSTYKTLQAHLPVRRQTEAVGHTVRALYLYSGMADVAVETGDRELLSVCRRLWKNITQRRMYLIGGVGSTPHGEAFSFDYDLPNETAYAETCANIALVFFAHRMLQIEADREYADVMERALYNGVLSGISLDGKRFFYVNPLAVHPDALKDAPAHIAATRQEWFGCACCPPNIARMVAQLPGYVYSTGHRAVYLHLYAQGRADLQVGGMAVRIAQQTAYPWEGEVTIAVTPQKPAIWTLALRIPGWCRQPRLEVNGEAVGVTENTTRGYARIRREWKEGDKVKLMMPMPPERVEAHPLVRQNCGRIALQRGPLVYCLEEADNGKALNDIVLPGNARLVVKKGRALSQNVPFIVSRGERRRLEDWGQALHRPVRSKKKTILIKAMPYFMWANRKPGEMLVWIRET